MSQDSCTRKFSSTTISLLNKSPIPDSEISHAYEKFTKLISQYKIQHNNLSILQQNENKSSPFSTKGKTNNFTIMAKLRHLENVACLNNANHQKSQREKKKNNLVAKNSIRKRKKWLKLENGLNQPYSQIYKSIKKQDCKNNIISSLNDLQQQGEDQSEAGQNIEHQETILKILQYSKQLKPYKKVIQYTKDKMNLRAQFITRSQEDQRRARSLQELKSACKHKKIHNQFTDLAKITAIKQAKQKKSNDQSVGYLMRRTFKKIFKSCDNRQDKYEEIKGNQRYCKFIEKQNQLIRNAQKTTQSTIKNNKNLLKLKARCKSIVLELCKGQAKQIKQNEVHRISQSLNLKRGK